MLSDPTPTPSTRPVVAESAMVVLGGLLVIMPCLFVSSPHYREAGVLVFGIATVLLGGCIPQVRQVAGDRWIRRAVACLLVVHAVSFAGGLRHGEPVGQALAAGFSGIVSVLGMGVLTVILLQPRWRRWAWWTFIGMAAMLVVASLLGFFVFTRWHEDLSKLTLHMDPRRLALVWPTRLLIGELGRQYWDHTNTAAYLFAAAWAVVVNALFCRPKYDLAGWALALLLALAVFLTASRSAWVMMICVLPPLLAFRGWRFALQVTALLTLTGFLGFAGMTYKIERLAKPLANGQSAPPKDSPGKIHLSGLIKRGSTGRTSAYQALWRELDGNRLLGQGLAVTRKPIVHLLHEHSSYLATMRGGGLVALAAHLMLIGCTLLVALRLARNGSRWPLLLAVAVFSGLLFDRSTVFRLTGCDEFHTHWLAVWIPLAMAARRNRGTAEIQQLPIC